MENLKNLLKALENNHARANKLLLNIIYYLSKNYFITKSLKELTIDDLMLVYDNLYINNEIVDSDNLEEYKEYLLKIKIRKSLINKIKDGSKILLLNYYDINGSLFDCKIALDNIYNDLVY